MADQGSGVAGPPDREIDDSGKPRSVAIVSTIVITVILTMVAWRWYGDRSLSRRAMAAHMAIQQPYAAQMLEELGTLPDELRESSGLAVSRDSTWRPLVAQRSGDRSRTSTRSIHQGACSQLFASRTPMLRIREDMSSRPMSGGTLTTSSPHCLYVRCTSATTIGPRKSSGATLIVKPLAR